MTFSLDFRPRRDGLPYDPQAHGGGVNLVRVYSDQARQVQVATAGPAVRLSPGVYRFTIPDLPDGTYYTSVTWTAAAGETPYTDSNDRFTLPVPDPMVARLRRLTDEPDAAGTYQDADMTAILDRNTDALGRVDIYAAAADVWEEKAVAQQASVGTRAVSVKSGDQQITYGTEDGAGSAWKMARLFRAKARAKTVAVSSPGARLRLLRPEQADAGLGHAYTPEQLSLMGIEP